MNKKYLKAGLITILAIIFVILLTTFSSTPKVDATKKQNLDLSLTENEFYIEETNYQTSMDEVIVPYINQFKSEGHFTTSDDATISYKQYLQNQPKGHIVISHGFTEFAEKYQEVIYYFLMDGYNVSILEHRGHGTSTREVEDLSMIYIDDFYTYTKDLKEFMETVVNPSISDEPCYLYAHSMGGGIGALFLEEYPEYFDAAVLTAPMLEVETGGVPIPVAKMIATVANTVGFGDSYVFGHSAFDGTYDFASAATSCESRYQYLFNKRLANTQYQTNGASFSWLLHALTGSKAASTNSHKVTIPVLLFQAGNDTYVRPGGQNTFVNNAPNATLIYVEDAKHELYCESDDIMIPYFNTIFNFFDQVA